MSGPTPLRQIVVAFDGSDESRAAARLGFRLASGCGAEVTLVQAIDPPGWMVAHPEMLADLEERRLTAEERALTDLERLAGEAPDGVAVDTALVRGRPGATLVDQLRERSADLVVLGTHGVGGARRALLGSVSQQVMEHAPCSALLVRDATSVDGRVTVIAAVDGSEPSLAALGEAQSVAVALGAPLRLVHVVELNVPFVGRVPETLRGEVHDHGEQILRQARDRVSAPLDEVVSDLREGWPRDELVEACAEHPPAIAVVGSRGLGGFAGLLVGSTARHLVNAAPCAVLVARERSEG